MYDIYANDPFNILLSPLCIAQPEDECSTQGFKKNGKLGGKLALSIGKVTAEGCASLGDSDLECKRTSR